MSGHRQGRPQSPPPPVRDFLIEAGRCVHQPIRAMVEAVGRLQALATTPALQEVARDLREQLQRLLQNTRDLHDHAHLTLGRMPLEILPFPLAPWLSEAIDSCREAAGQRGVRLTPLFHPQSPCTLQSDPFRGQQALTGLLRRAVRACPAGGTVEVSLEADPAAPSPGGAGIRLQLVTLPPDPTALPDSPDSARRPEIAESDQEGLGLVFVQGLANLLQGSVEERRLADGRPTWQLCLPCLPEPTGAGAPATDGAGGSTTGSPDEPATGSATDTGPADRPLILVVDDNLENRLVAAEMLRRRRFRVEEATTGGEALTKLASGEHRLVLMDCQMPGLDGLETTRRWRSEERRHGRRRVPVVAVTAYNIENRGASCLAAGMDAILVKPFTPHQLCDTVETWLQTAAGSSPGPGTGTDSGAVSGVVPDTRPASEAGDRKEVAPGAAAATTAESTGATAAAIQTAPTPPVVLDRQRLEQIFAPPGERHLATLIRGFLTNTPARLQRLEAAVQRNDPHQCEFHAHSIKGAAAMLAADELRSLAAEAEGRAGAGDLIAVEHLLARMKAAFVQLREALLALVPPPDRQP